MSELKWFDGYNGESTAELIALEGEFRTDSLVLAFEQAVDQKIAEVGSDGITEAERVIVAVEALEREVNNGGYEQFFVNSSCEYAPVIVNSLKAIGCTTTAAITQRAIDALGPMPTLDAEVIEKVMSREHPGRSNALGHCDQEFFQMSEDIAGALFAYIKENQAAILAL